MGIPAIPYRQIRHFAHEGGGGDMNNMNIAHEGGGDIVQEIKCNRGLRVGGDMMHVRTLRRAKKLATAVF